MSKYDGCETTFAQSLFHSPEGKVHCINITLSRCFASVIHFCIQPLSIDVHDSLSTFRCKRLRKQITVNPT